MLDEQVAPGSVTQLGRAFRGRNQIGEHHRRQDTLGDEKHVLAGNEPLESSTTSSERKNSSSRARNTHRAGGRNARPRPAPRSALRVRAVKDEVGTRIAGSTSVRSSRRMRGGAHTRPPGLRGERERHSERRPCLALLGRGGEERERALRKPTLDQPARLVGRSVTELGPRLGAPRAAPRSRRGLSRRGSRRVAGSDVAASSSTSRSSFGGVQRSRFSTRSATGMVASRRRGGASRNRAAIGGRGCVGP